MRQPQLIRDRIIRHLHALRVEVSCLPETEPEVLLALGGIPFVEPDRLVQLANLLLAAMGHQVEGPKDPRFDKTRRALAKKTLKPPRGLSPRERAAARGK